ncbi:16S rRNA (uracil(1498)-N(3))-methyltransferase [Oleiphilus sp. HI0009]|uniref:16S rRNA (uracil(1498)-N(3))-methyltransferase n=3 Tax=Oleiphilus TaxID=141450 RepID=UPI0007C397E9|nr:MULTISPECIES: 16S rRNA (uracil(1498)-N(3))-methyltransferase [unclassified Oleiphilus]KZX75369.1 16S rRNA (uracil(1498)-N(3))-methyltransferase [Oleiphilus sp. HI0009]KZY65366.1 16S rRNA (uracil(1498)-N(3))-methyltransferase [Oleiphilus sp. HI0066]KZY68413.1 16S rRNA (uracil(1498)-N(3))-methyltransferase [Oleiphilus sp. HI0067]KZY72039.1 16S rRNA (uracil(1498)-N(3))-methyltransferase [Oleiphilus sp. HI0066]
MNLLLLSPNNIIDESTAVIKGRQLEHIHKTLRAKTGDTLSVGIENGLIGKGTLTELNQVQAKLTFRCTKQAPAPLPIKLVLALPRPKMLRRIIQTAVTMGVKDFTFINAWKVEKSYWQTPWLNEESLRENALIGLEQAKDTVMPVFKTRKLFKPFVEDELSDLAGNDLKLIAHPHTETPCPVQLDPKQPVTLAIGPEGGFTKYEVSKFYEQQFESVHLGDRILRTETAVPALLSRLYPA